MKRIKLIYKPRVGAAFMAPTLMPGEVIEVDAEEAEAKLATGVFEVAPDPKPVEASSPARVNPKQKASE